MMQWLRGLRARLMVMVFIPLLILVPFGISAYRQIDGQDIEIKNFIDVHLPQSSSVGQMSKELQTIMRFLWSMYGAEDDVKSREYAQLRVDESLKKIEELKAKFESIHMDDQEKALWNEFSSAWGPAQEKIRETERLFAVGTQESHFKGKEHILKEIRPALVPVEKVLDTLGQMQVEETDRVGEETVAHGEQFKILIWFWVAGGSLLIVVLGIFYAFNLSRRFSAIAHHISSSADEVNGASRQLSGAGQRLSSGATQAASSLEETVASIEELSAMVKANADNSKEAGALSQQARGSAEQGAQEVQHLVEAIAEISTSSRKIEEIINVIDDISFQTNLLALNAAVEAARAGEQGRGFAVVAEAVRALAQRSSEAAKDINGLIKESVTKVERGTQLADRSGSVLKQIVENSKKVADLTAEIAQASQEQSTGLGQISGAMNQLDQATQSNAASAEETAATAQELSNESTSLHKQVRELLELVDGAGAVTAVQVSSDADSHEPMRHEMHVAPVSKSKPKATVASNVIPFDDDHVNSTGTDGF